MRQARFPVVKTLADSQIEASSIPQPTFGYLASLKWIGAAAKSRLIGPYGVLGKVM